MLSRRQFLLLKLVEECGEVAERALKSMQYGTKEVQDGHNLDNGNRILVEWADLVEVFEQLIDDGAFPAMAAPCWPDHFAILKQEKREKLRTFAAKARDLGQVEDVYTPEFWALVSDPAANPPPPPPATVDVGRTGTVRVAAGGVLEVQEHKPPATIPPEKDVARSFPPVHAVATFDCRRCGHKWQVPAQPFLEGGAVPTCPNCGLVWSAFDGVAPVEKGSFGKAPAPNPDSPLRKDSAP